MAQSQGGREELPLSGPGWRVWLDKAAPWQNDHLFLPDEVKLATVPVNAPTCGWDGLNDSLGVKCELPCSVEEIFSGGVNSWTYHGVSWFWKDLNIPANWSGRKILLKVEKQRMRAEIYLNGKLAGYDLIPETPCKFDLTPFVQAGMPNHLAIRITNAGGQRSWEDFGFIKWGGYQFPSSHDFGGLGHVTMEAVDPVYVSDLFVKNLQPAGDRKIEARATIENSTGASMSRNITVSIVGDDMKTVLVSNSSANVELKAGENNFVVPLSVPKAQLWDIDHPTLYHCKVSLSSGNDLSDEYSVRFGFRVFEVKDADGGFYYYLNGKRIRLRSAIDWGFYALTGLFPTDEMAKKSVQAALAIGHNSINFHRRIGEPLVMDYADELGLYLFEEPGGFHIQQGYNVVDGTFASKVEIEKCRRMFLRDRNRPSLLIFNLCNEDNAWNKARETVMKMASELDGTRLVSNTSGANVKGPPGGINNIRPYETEIRHDFRDDHTVKDQGRFQESDLGSHQSTFPMYWGEVRCYTGPADFCAISDMQKSLPDDFPGYDLNVYRPMANKLDAFFHDFRLADTGSRTIRSPQDVSRQAGRGLMYIDGRLSQTIMSGNLANGYAINGWSAGPQMPDAWDSAICDEGRNLKGPAEDYAYWTRPLQIVISRNNGKYFEPGQTANFSVNLINEGKLEPGDYDLQFEVTDGAGKQTEFASKMPVHLVGGDTYAQSLAPLTISLDSKWKAGYITVEGKLYQNGKVVADGCEQVLLTNRPTWTDDLTGLRGSVCQWPAAEEALKSANALLTTDGHLDYIAMGSPPTSAIMDKALAAVHDEGTLLVLKFDKDWAQILFDRGILTSPVIAWGGTQTGKWNGNGWGYLDHFIGDQAVPSRSTIGTTSWEVPADPVGFWPLETQGQKYAYGAYLARPPLNKSPQPSGLPDPQNPLLILIGALDYGKGKIILDAAYPVDDLTPLNDMLFYNLISQGCKGQW